MGSLVFTSRKKILWGGLITALMVFIFLSQNNFIQPTYVSPNIINLERVDVPSDSSSSRVYKITSGDGAGFLISTDEILTLPDDTSYTLEELHVNEFWNPVSCSRVPFVKDASRIYFLELARISVDEEISNVSNIYVLDIKSRGLTRYQIQDVITTGYLYKDTSGIYLASPSYSDDILVSLTFYALHTETATLQKIKTIKTSSYHIENPIFKRSNLKFAFSYYATGLNLKSFVYEGGNLNESKLVPEGHISNKDNLYRIYDFAVENFITKSNLTEFDSVQIIDKKSGKTLIELKEDDVNKYVITEI